MLLGFLRVKCSPNGVWMYLSICYLRVVIFSFEVFIGIPNSQGFLGKGHHLIKRWTFEFLFPRDMWVSNCLDFPTIQNTSYSMFPPHGQGKPYGKAVPPFRRPQIVSLSKGGPKLSPQVSLFTKITLHYLSNMNPSVEGEVFLLSVNGSILRTCAFPCEAFVSLQEFRHSRQLCALAYEVWISLKVISGILAMDVDSLMRVINILRGTSVEPSTKT